MIGDRKEIQAGDDSTNIQGNNVTVNQQNGMDYLQVRQVAMDVFKSNFYDLGEKVEKLVNDRAEEIVNKYLKKLEEESPEAINNTEDPDVRYAIYEVQKSYARLGDKEMGDLLVDVLMQRTMNQDESFEKLVLNEALTIIPKLTTKQIDILSLIHIMRYLNFKPEFQIPFEHYYSFLHPFINKRIIPKKEIFYQHLQYAGCLSISIGSSDFNNIIKHKFPHLFDKVEDVNEIVSNFKLESFRNEWDTTKLCNSSLTSVGIAIALSNINRRLGVKWDLSIWVNE